MFPTFVTILPLTIPANYRFSSQFWSVGLKVGVRVWFGCVALFGQPITPTAHYSDNPLLRRPISPTMQNRTQSTNPRFNQVYPTGCSVGQANLDGPWPRQNVLERKMSFYPRLYNPVKAIYDRPTWYGES